MNGVNIKRHSDRLDHLLARCEQEIRQTEEKLRALKAGRDNLNLMAQELAKPAAPQPEPVESRDTGITKSVLEVINNLWRVQKNALTLTED